MYRFFPNAHPNSPVYSFLSTRIGADGIICFPHRVLTRFCVVLPPFHGIHTPFWPVGIYFITAFIEDKTALSFNR
jgi:hypothetical protein